MPKQLTTADLNTLADTVRLCAGRTQFAILMALADDPGQSVSELAEAIGGPAVSGVSQLLTKMKMAGVLECERDGQSMLYKLAKSSRVAPALVALATAAA